MYKQRILEGRKFRLLFILPSDDSRQQLECHCFPFDIDSAPAYEALSYVWGVEKTTTEVNFNGSPIAIGSSLADALSRLRDPSSTRIVWADGLCINQQDAAEKSHQVPLMGSIYSKASRVVFVVWLGHQDFRLSLTAKVMVHFIGEECIRHDRSRGQPVDAENRYGALDISAEDLAPEGLESLRQLFSCRWFTRIWCVQEICLARQAIVLYGDVEIPWEAVGLTASWIFDKTTGPGEKDALALEMDDILSANADLLCDKDIKGSLLEVLQFFREFDASDPKDRVYGLLNLVTEKREIEALEVNYDKTREQVYADTTLVMIRLCSRLTTLAWVFHHKNYNGAHGMRSWSPIWDEADSTAVLGYPERLCPWSAGGNKPVKAVDDDSCIGYDQLRLSGIFYDIVTHVHEIMTPKKLEDPPKAGKHHPFVTTNRAFEDIHLSPEVNSPEHYRKLARTLTAAEVESTPVGPAAKVEDQEAFYADFMDVMQWHERLTCDEMVELETLGSNAREIREQTYHTCKQRRMFVMENGLFGLGPQCMRAGDVAVVLYGGNTPYVLRPTGEKDEYLFMGAAYVDEIMQGELVQEVRDGFSSEQKFCLV